MGEETQVLVPEAFAALFVEPGRSRPTLPRAEIAQRHELCEDLAQSLTDRARLVLWEHGVAEEDVLLRIFQGLVSPDSGLLAAEAEWVTRRLAELLEWAQPGELPAPGATAAPSPAPA
jgi:hypothetical protein